MNWSPNGLKRQNNDVRYEFSPEAMGQFEEKFTENVGPDRNSTARLQASDAFLCEVVDDTRHIFLRKRNGGRYSSSPRLSPSL